jgi:hypothetical protein
MTPLLRRRAAPALLAGLILWCLVPVVLMTLHAAADGLRLTGADGIVGADQLQYLSWVRDAAGHGLASDLFELAPNPHAFLQPMFGLSALLSALHVPLVVAYWLWKPVAAAVLFAGAAAWSTRFFPRRSGAALAGLTLGLFLSAPVAEIVLWAAAGSASTRAALDQLAGEVFAAGALWGYLPTAVAVGLMPVVLLATERAARSLSPRAARGPLAVAAVSALLVSWLHPWQGLTVLLILVALAVWERGRGWPVLATAAAAALLPLVYYELLSREDAAWRLASRNELVPHLPAGALVLGLLPLALGAAAGLRRPGRELAERALVLWVPAALAVYFAFGSFPSHALEGLSLPVAVLGVRGWGRIARRGGAAGAAGALLAVAAVTLPGMAYEARAFHRRADSPVQEYYLTGSESRALDWIAARAPAGGVLADELLSIDVPAQTGRAVWVGHEFWSRDYLVRARAVEAIFAGAMAPAAVRAIVTGSGARLVLADCGQSRAVGGPLAPLVASTHRFGCATVYVLRR